TAIRLLEGKNVLHLLPYFFRQFLQLLELVFAEFQLLLDGFLSEQHDRRRPSLEAAGSRLRPGDRGQDDQDGRGRRASKQVSHRESPRDEVNEVTFGTFWDYGRRATTVVAADNPSRSRAARFRLGKWLLDRISEASVQDVHYII